MSKKSTLIVYGLPCTGKSSVVKAMNDYYNISVDSIIKGMVADPSILDFNRLSLEIIEIIISKINTSKVDKYIVEMGCLIPKKAIDLLERSLSDLDFAYINIKLSANEEELVKRIIERNELIDAGKNEGIKVAGPDYLTRFKLQFDKNQPDKLIDIDTTGKTTKSIALVFLERIK